MQNLHAIHVKYLGPTDTKGARIKLISKRFKESITINRNYEMYARDQAISYLTNKGFVIIGLVGDEDIILSTTFESIK